jgi:cytochrome b
VVLLLAALLGQAGAGLFADDGIATAGPLAKRVSDAMSDRLTSLHARGAWVLVALVAVHVGAVIVYLVALRDNLIGPMFTGTKRLPRRLADTVSRPAAHLRALVLLALCALATWAIA